MFASIKNQIEKSSTFVPAQKIFNNNPINKTKFLWMIYSLLAFSTCIYFIYKYISEYYDYQTISQIEIKNEVKLNFPIVTICNINFLVTDYQKQLQQNFKNEYSLLFETISSSKDFSSKVIQLFLMKSILQSNLKSIYPNSSVIDPKKFGFLLEDVMLSCAYGSLACDPNEDFSYLNSFEYTNCFSFNSGKNMTNHNIQTKVSTLEGIYNGLILELFIDSTENYDKLFSLENGYMVFIKNENGVLGTSGGIKVAPGYSTTIKISRYSISKTPYPYSECRNPLKTLNDYDSELYRKVLEQNEKYHFTYCKHICYQKYFGDKCGCQNYIFEQIYYKDKRLCNRTDSKCIYDSIIYLINNLEVLEQCDCPIECENIGYWVSPSVSEFPTKAFADILTNHPIIKSKFSNQTITYDKIKKSVLQISIFYDELKQTYITHSAKLSAFDVFSNIGGILSLFLGFGILTIIEAVEILFKIITHSLSEKANKIFTITNRPVKKETKS